MPCLLRCGTLDAVITGAVAKVSSRSESAPPDDCIHPPAQPVGLRSSCDGSQRRRGQKQLRPRLRLRRAPPPLPPPVPESGAPSRGVSGESPIRHGLIWPVTWAAIIVGSGTVLLLLWALVFRGGSEPQQQAEKDQPLLAAAQSAEPRASAPVPQAVPQPTKNRAGRSPSSGTEVGSGNWQCQNLGVGGPR